MKVKIYSESIPIEMEIPLKKKPPIIRGIQISPEAYAYYTLFEEIEGEMFAALFDYGNQINFKTQCNKDFYESLNAKIKAVIADKFPNEYKALFGN